LSPNSCINIITSEEKKKVQIYDVQRSNVFFLLSSKLNEI